MTKRKSTEAFTQLMADGVDGSDITLDTSAKVITRDDNKRIVAVLDKSLNPK